MKYLYGKNVFLTGGSSGIGLAAAELFAANGYTVFAASRDPIPGIRGFPGGGAIRPVKLDVRDLQSIDEAADAVLTEADIGIVIHCAGIGIACPGEEYPSEAVTALMETNFNGVLCVNSRFLPHLRERGSGLCIITGSLAGILPIPFQSHYSASKAALDLYAASLRMELRDFGVRVSLVMPGDTSTGFTDARKYGIGKNSVFYGACIGAVKKMETDERSGRPPASVARSMIKISERKNPPVRLTVGFDYKLLAFLRRLLPDKMILFILRAIYMKR